MATPTEVKNYLAQWLQLGKKISFKDQAIGTTNILRGDGYSAEFEQIWAEVTAEPDKAYLEGTDESISTLLDNRWDMLSCVRCGMLAPTIAIGPRATPACPCADIELWPNLETISPRSPVSSQDRLHQIRDRIFSSTALFDAADTADTDYPDDVNNAAHGEETGQTHHMHQVHQDSSSCHDSH
jgi:hypothetical protein